MNYGNAADCCSNLKSKMSLTSSFFLAQPFQETPMKGSTEPVPVGSGIFKYLESPKCFRLQCGM